MRAPVSPNSAQAGGGERFRRREDVGEAELTESGDGGTEAFHQAPRDRARAGDRHLLADDRAHADLERIPGPDGAQAGQPDDARADQRVVPERPVGGGEIDVQVEQPPHLLDHVDEAVPVRQVCREDEVIWPAAAYLECAGIAVDHDRAPVGATGHILDTGDRPRPEEAQGLLPRERSGEPDPEPEAAVRDEAIGDPPPCSKLARRGAEDLPDGSVELSQAPEPRCERDIRHGEVGVIEEPASEMGTARARQLRRSHADLILEETPQVARRETEPGGDRILAGHLDIAAHHEPDAPAHQLGGGGRGRRRLAVGAAAQTRTVSGGLGRGGKVEVLDV